MLPCVALGLEKLNPEPFASGDVLLAFIVNVPSTFWSSTLSPASNNVIFILTTVGFVVLSTLPDTCT